jgi:hypothetical protein
LPGRGSIRSSDVGTPTAMPLVERYLAVAFDAF